MIIKHLMIDGLVQGVGYRASFADKAHALGLIGWVRNRLDGSVEAVIAGEPQAIEEMTSWARRGPPAARVEHVMVTDAVKNTATDAETAALLPARFEVLPTQ